MRPLVTVSVGINVCVTTHEVRGNGPHDTAKQTWSLVSSERQKESTATGVCKTIGQPLQGYGTEKMPQGLEHRCLLGQNTRRDDTPLRGMVDGPLVRGKAWLDD